MMRRIAAILLLAAPTLLAAASAPVAPAGESANTTLARARSEAVAATTRLRDLEAAAARAGDQAAKLRAERAVAAAAIEEAEAKISQSDANLRLAQARVALAEQRLATRRAPLAALLAGLATMGRQPPLLALADHGSVDEIVRVKALLDTTMPVIEQRSTLLKDELAERRRLATSADAARDELASSREELAHRQQRFAELEDRAARRASVLSGKAFGAGDRVLASSERLESAASEAAAHRTAQAAAGALARLDFAPARPMRGDSALPPSDFAYSLPVSVRLVDGLGSVNRAGIVSRGLRFDTPRRADVIVPADGKIVFAAPYRGQDGLVIIDHGKGWTSLLLGVASDRPKGTKVRRGEFLGRALGPIGVELRRDGRPISPAFIAASSVPLSNGGNNR